MTNTQWLKSRITQDFIPGSGVSTRFLSIWAPGLEQLVAVAESLAEPFRSGAVDEAAERLLKQKLPSPAETRSAESHEQGGNGRPAVWVSLEISSEPPISWGSGEWRVSARCARRNANASVEYIVTARHADPRQALRVATDALTSGVEMPEVIEALRHGHRWEQVNVYGHPAKLELHSVTGPPQ